MDHLTRRAALAAAAIVMIALALHSDTWFSGTRAGVQSTAGLTDATACKDGSCVDASLAHPFGHNVESAHARVLPSLPAADERPDGGIRVDPGWSAFADAALYTRSASWSLLSALALFLLAVVARAHGILHGGRKYYRPFIAGIGALLTIAAIALLLSAPDEMSPHLSVWLAIGGATCAWVSALPSVLVGERTDVDLVRVTAPPPIGQSGADMMASDSGSLAHKPVASASGSLAELGTRKRRNTLPENFVASATATKPPPTRGARRRQVRNTGTVGTTPMASVDALLGALRFCANTCEIVRDGMRWTEPGGAERSLVWADVSFVAARLLPAEPPFDRTLVVDVALDFGSPLRLLPATRVNYGDLPGGASTGSRDNLRRLGAFIVAQNPGAKIESDSVDFFEHGRAPRAYLAISQFEAWDQQYS